MIASYQPEQIEQQIASLESERQRITERRKRRRAAAERDEKRWVSIHDQLQRLAVLKLVGVPNAVKLKHAYPSGDKAARLNDKLGTIEKVNRTRAIVEFPGEPRPWSWPIECLIPADAPQGFVFATGGRQ